MTIFLAAASLLSADPNSGTIDRSSGQVVSDNGSQTIALLLAANTGVSEQERIVYVRRCEAAAFQYPESPLRVMLYKQIGDVYFECNNIRYAPQWHKWYNMAVALDGAISKNTPVGFRLGEYHKIAARKNCIAFAVAFECLVLLYVLGFGLKNRKSLDGLLFLKKCVMYLAVFALASAAVFFLDALLLMKIIAAGHDPFAAAFVKSATVFVKPFIPLSGMDFSAAGRAAMVLCLGFLPILLAAFCSSFSCPPRRGMTAILVVVATVAVWAHFVAVTAFDKGGNSRVFVTGTRIVYRGEPEKLLLDNPQKALRANPGILQSDNPDLKEFMEDHYPKGIVGKGK
jgi:hypothetical protein